MAAGAERNHRALPGTERAESVFWAEGEELAVFAEAGSLNLYKIDLRAGGFPQLIPGFQPSIGAGSYQQDVLLLGQQGRGIARMPAAGGAAVTITTLDESRQEISHSWPQILAGGRHFLYFARNRNATQNAIYAASLDGKFRKHLLTSESLARYVPAGQNTGYLLYVKGGVLFADPFDAEKLELSGKPKVSRVQCVPISLRRGRILSVGRHPGVPVGKWFRRSIHLVRPPGKATGNHRDSWRLWRSSSFAGRKDPGVRFRFRAESGYCYCGRGHGRDSPVDVRSGGGPRAGVVAKRT
jgi:hypothetical protein